MCHKNKNMYTFVAKSGLFYCVLGSVVHPCCDKLRKILSLFNDNIYNVHIISYSKSYILLIIMIINTEGPDFFFIKPQILRLSMTETPFGVSSLSE